jgi:cytochrome b561
VLLDRHLLRVHSPFPFPSARTDEASGARTLGGELILVLILLIVLLIVFVLVRSSEQLPQFFPVRRS